MTKEEQEKRKEAYKDYYEEMRYEWGDNVKIITFEKWEKEFEENYDSNWDFYYSGLI